MTTRLICICWDCKQVKDISRENLLTWLGAHYGHSIRIGERNNDDVWRFWKLPSEEAEG